MSKLFFKINSFIGKNSALDMLIVFCGKYLIFALFLLTVVFGLSLERELRIFYFLFGFCTYAFGLGLSFLIAFLYKSPRPIATFPKKTKTLINTFGTWKSFPSDHTYTAFLFAFWIKMFSVSIPLILTAFSLALLIALGRVFAGVHYPKDIVGGFLLAFLMALSFHFYLIG